MCLLGVSYSIIMVRFLCFYWEISIEIIFSQSFTEFYSKVGRARIGDLGKICSSQDAKNFICKKCQKYSKMIGYYCISIAILSLAVYLNNIIRLPNLTYIICCNAVIPTVLTSEKLFNLKVFFFFATSDKSNYKLFYATRNSIMSADILLIYILF